MKADDKEIYKEFGKRLKELRISHGYTQVELADTVGLSQTAIVQYEAGSRKIPLSTLRIFSDFYNLTLDELIDPPASSESPVDSIEKNFSHIIRNLRKQRNLSRMELASEIDMTVDEISKYETNTKELPLSILMKFSSFFDVTINELIGFDMSQNDASVFVSTNPRQVKLHKQWSETVGEFDWTDEEHKKLMDFALFLISQREK